MPPLCGMTVPHTAPTLLNILSSLLLALLYLFIPTLLRSHSPTCLSLGLLAGRLSSGGDGAASCSSSGCLSTDSVLPVSKRSSPLHPPVVSTACKNPNLWKSLYAFMLHLCPSVFLPAFLLNPLEHSTRFCHILLFTVFICIFEFS